MNYYLIPGLGADKRMYESLMKELNGGEVLEFFIPEIDDTIENYAQKFIPKIKVNEPFVLIGTSMGGIMCVELLKHIKPEKVILIATVKSRSEMPVYLRVLKFFPIHRLLPASFYIGGVIWMAKNGATRLFKKEGQMIIDMAKSANPGFIKWGINAVLNWKGEKVVSENLFHIHGTRDPLFPIKNIDNPIRVHGGTHVMNITRPAEINGIVKRILETP